MKTKRIKLEKTKTGISLELTRGTSSKNLFEIQHGSILKTNPGAAASSGGGGGKTRTRVTAKVTRPKIPAPKVESAVGRRIRDLLNEPAIHMSKELWKLLGESPTLVYSKRPGVPGDAELTYFSKDKSHALLLDGNIPGGKLSQKQAYLFAHQLARGIVDSELPIKTVTVAFYLPEGSPFTQKLLNVFDAGYTVPGVNLSGALLSSVAIVERGARQAKNSMRYKMGLTYKGEKITLTVTVKVVEFQAQLFQ